MDKTSMNNIEFEKYNIHWKQKDFRHCLNKEEK